MKHKIIPLQLMQLLDKLEALGKEIRDQVVPGNKDDKQTTLESASKAAVAYGIWEGYFRIMQQKNKDESALANLSLTAAASVAYSYGGANCDLYSAMSGFLIANAGAHWGVKITSVARYAHEERHHSFLELTVELDSGENYTINFDPWATNKDSRYSGLREDFLFYDETYHKRDQGSGMISGIINYNTLADAKKHLEDYGRLLLEEAGIKIDKTFHFQSLQGVTRFENNSGFEEVVYIAEEEPPCPIDLADYANPSIELNPSYPYTVCLLPKEKEFALKKNTIYLEKIAHYFKPDGLRYTLINADEQKVKGEINPKTQLGITLKNPLTLEQLKPSFLQITKIVHQNKHIDGDPYEQPLANYASEKKNKQNNIFNKVVGDIDNKITNWRQFCSMYKGLRDDHKILLFNKILNGPSSKEVLLEKGFAYICKMLPEEQKDLLYKKAFDTAETNHYFKKNVTQEESVILFSTLKLEQYSDFLGKTNNAFPVELICTNFEEIYNTLDEERRNILCTIIGNNSPRFVAILRNNRFKQIYESLTPQNKEQLISVIKDGSSQMVLTLLDLQRIYEALNVAHKAVFFNRIKDDLAPFGCANEINIFSTIYLFLDEVHQNELFTRLKNAVTENTTFYRRYFEEHGKYTWLNKNHLSELESLFSSKNIEHTYNLRERLNYLKQDQINVGQSESYMWVLD